MEFLSQYDGRSELKIKVPCRRTSKRHSKLQRSRFLFTSRSLKQLAVRSWSLAFKFDLTQRLLIFVRQVDLLEFLGELSFSQPLFVDLLCSYLVFFSGHCGLDSPSQSLFNDRRISSSLRRGCGLIVERGSETTKWGPLKREAD